MGQREPSRFYDLTATQTAALIALYEGRGVGGVRDRTWSSLVRLGYVEPATRDDPDPYDDTPDEGTYLLTARGVRLAEKRRRQIYRWRQIWRRGACP